jgi:hypothetical protein
MSPVSVLALLPAGDYLTTNSLLQLSTLKFKVKGKFLLRLTISRSVCLGVKPHLGPRTRFLLLSDSFGFFDVRRPIWQEDGSVVYNCCWPSSPQSFSGLSPPRLWTKIYGLLLETPPTWRARSPYLYPPGTRWPSYTPRHYVTFSSPPTIRRDTLEVFIPASTRTTFDSQLTVML